MGFFFLKAQGSLYCWESNNKLESNKFWESKNKYKFEMRFLRNK